MTLLDKIQHSSESISFSEVISHVDANFDFTLPDSPTAMPSMKPDKTTGAAKYSLLRS